MAKTRQQKDELKDSYQKRLEASNAVYFFDPDKVSGSQLEEMRDKLFEDQASLSVLKNTVFNLTVQESKLKEAGLQQFEGPTAAVFCEGEVTGAAKIIAEFAKETELGEIKGGILEEHFVTPEEVIQLSQLPSKQELLGQVVAYASGPITGFMNVTSGPLRGFVNILNELKTQKSE